MESWTPRLLHGSLIGLMEIKQFSSYTYTLIAKKTVQWSKMKENTESHQENWSNPWSRLETSKTDPYYHLNTLFLNISNIEEFFIYQFKYFKHKIEYAVRWHMLRVMFTPQSYKAVSSNETSRERLHLPSVQLYGAQEGPPFLGI